LEKQIGFDMKNLALIGCGHWGKNIARNLATLGALKTIVEANPTVAKLASELDCQFTDDLSATLKDPDIHAVLIATPAATHLALAELAIQAGKDVYVEKPIALSVADGKKMQSLAEAKGRILMVGHLLQYHAAYRRLCDIVQSGELGSIKNVTCNRLSFGLLRSEENVMWSFSPHDISMLLGLVGQVPINLQAAGTAFLQKDVADVVSIHLNFAGGITADVRSSWYHPRKEQTFTVACEKGMIVFDDTKAWDQKLTIYRHEVVWSGAKPKAVAGAVETVSLEASEPLLLEMEHFIACVASRQKPLTDAVEALQVLAVLQAAQASLDSSGKLIALPPVGLKSPQIHASAIVGNNVEIGTGTRVWHFSHILDGSRIGQDCNIGQNVMIGPDVTVGNGCKIQNNVALYKGVVLEDDVFCGPSMVFTNVLTPRAHINRRDEFLTTRVGRGATLGANCTIVCGHNIGPYAMVGAGALVSKPVAAYSLVVGNPARKIGWVCQCGERLSEQLLCERCGSTYEEKNGKLSPSAL
jgi:UDP-2-acetamido-3-amino-2,3-dideoxy-glucuronate N-acetyltransferase